MKKITLINACLSIALLLTGVIIYANHCKRKADRKACLLNIRNIHIAVRSDLGIKRQNIGDPLDWSEIFSSPTSEKYLEEPTCPHDGSRYILTSIHPKIGVPAVKCPNCDSLDHQPEDTTDW